MESKKNILEKEIIIYEGKKIFIPPVVTNISYNRYKMKKYTTYRCVKHIYKDNKETKLKEYKHTLVTIEEDEQQILQKDIQDLTKRELLEEIQRKVKNVDLSKINSKKDVLTYLCNQSGAVSNREKRRYGVELCNRIVREKEEDYKEKKTKLNEELNEKENKLQENGNDDEIMEKFKKFKKEKMREFHKSKLNDLNEVRYRITTYDISHSSRFR